MTDKVQKRTLEGIVISDKMNKTRVVAIEQWKKMRKYLKYVRKLKRFKAHDEANEYKTGDRVIIEQTRPMSRDKNWKIVKKVGSLKSIERFIIRHPKTIKREQKSSVVNSLIAPAINS